MPKTFTLYEEDSLDKNELALLTVGGRASSARSLPKMQPKHYIVIIQKLRYKKVNYARPMDVGRFLLKNVGPVIRPVIDTIENELSNVEIEKDVMISIEKIQLNFNNKSTLMP